MEGGRAGACNGAAGSRCGAVRGDDGGRGGRGAVRSMRCGAGWRPRKSTNHAGTSRAQVTPPALPVGRSLLAHPWIPPPTDQGGAPEGTCSYSTGNVDAARRRRPNGWPGRYGAGSAA